MCVRVSALRSPISGVRCPDHFGTPKMEILRQNGSKRGSKCDKWFQARDESWPKNNLDTDMGFSVMVAEQRFLHHLGEKIHRYSIRYHPFREHVDCVRNRHLKFDEFVWMHGPQIMQIKFEGIRQAILRGTLAEGFRPLSFYLAFCLSWFVVTNHRLW